MTSGFEVRHSRLEHWNLLLREWLQCFERMCDFTDTTPSWNLVEDSNKGPFAGAIWRVGWIAFPELKRKRTSLGGYGQTDFYVACPPLRIAEYVECKGNRVSTSGQAASILNEAYQHVQTIIDDEGALRIGVAFCNIALQTIADSVTALTDKLLGEIKRNVSYDAIAWSFPESVRAYEEERGWFTPGVVLLARLVE